MDEHETLVQWFDRWLNVADPVGYVKDVKEARKHLAEADAAFADLRQKAGEARAACEREHIRALNDRDSLRAERDAVLAELDGVQQERDGLREAQAWIQAERAAMRKHWEGWRAERDALRRQSVTPTILQATMEHEPTRLEAAVQLAAGMCADERRLTTDGLVDTAWMLAGRLLAKARAEAVPDAPPTPLASDMQAKYHELLYAVVRCFPGESRHQTALRYIRETERAVAEAQQCACSGTATAPATEAGGKDA